MAREAFDFTLELKEKYAFDFLNCFLLANVIERSFPAHQLVGQDTNAPNINTTIISISLGNFRAHVI